jgi:basic membrane protein A
MKKHLLSLLVVLLVFCMLTVGCTQDGEAATAEPEEEPGEDVAVVEEPEEDIRVAVLMDGPVNDQGWNALAFSAVELLREKYDLDVSYAESVQQSDNDEVIRNYILAGYNVIYGHGYNFTDACITFAEEFPEVIFIVGGVDIAIEPNLASLNVDNFEQGFLQGATAAILSEVQKVGSVSGMEIPPITDAANGFKAGALYARPDIEVVTTYTGDFMDAGKAKETAKALIDQGCDVVMADAGSAALGALEGAVEGGALYVGSNGDLNPQGPDTVVTCVIDDFVIGIDLVIKEIMDGEFEPKMYLYKVADGVTYMTPYHGFEDKLSQGVKDEIATIYGELQAGTLDARGVSE